MAGTARANTGLLVHPAENPRTGIAPVPTRLDCLRCQLLGRRRLVCSRADECKEIPHNFFLGPVLLGAWLLTAIGFVVSIWHG